ncbi:DNA primase [bacterium]|nr:DNA primase [bacterium]
MIPEDKIQEIREATDILEVISQHVTLKKRGKNYIGLCPFHSEKTPSFNVDPVRGFYKCFGCGEGGNVFSFLMQMERISFPEAVRTLANRAGIALPESSEDDSRLKETELLYLANKHAAAFYQRCLTATPEGKKALAYFSGRGFSDEMAQQFQVGYAPDSWDSLLISARKAGIKPETLLKAGLVIARKDGSGYYDRFRCRLMFPVLNPSGRVVGFGGRILKKGEKSPKYLNSPETAVYHKGRLLYGLHESKAGIRTEDRLMLVEGYTDVIRCHQCGAGFAVATSGTALTEEQAKLIARYTKNVYLVYDGDSAGFEAALRGADILFGAGLHVSVAPLPGGSDPDSYLKGKGPEAVAALLERGSGIIDFRLEGLKAAGRLTNTADKAEAAHGLMATVRRIQDPIEKNMVIKELAEKLGIEEKVLLEQSGRDDPSGRIIPAAAPVRPVDKSTARAEKNLLRLLFEDSLLWGGKLYRLLTPDSFFTAEHRRLFTDIGSAREASRQAKPEELLDRYAADPGMAHIISELMAEPLDENVDREKLAVDCIIRLKQAGIEQRIQQVRDDLRRQQSGEKSETSREKQYLTLKRELTAVAGTVADQWRHLVAAGDDPS